MALTSQNYTSGNELQLPALPLDPSGIIALRTLMQTAQHTTGPSSARPATNTATDRTMQRSEARRHERLRRGFSGFCCWDAHAPTPHRASDLMLTYRPMIV